MATTTVTERLVNRLARFSERRTSRRSFVAAAALTGTALAVDPWGYVTRPQSAYASVCGPGATCDAGWSVFCCSINDGHNICPPNTYAGGWWKADRSSFCGGAARYYIDCNAKPGHHFTCRCNHSNCDQRYVACNVFRYGQCNTQVHGVTAVVCRQISCLPPWELYPGTCGRSSATDNNTAEHSAPCLTKANSNPNLVTFPHHKNYFDAGSRWRATGAITAADRHTEVYFSAEGNLSIRNQHGIVWQSGTHGRAAGGQVTLSKEGVLSVLDAKGKVVWHVTSTHRFTAAKLVIYDNGQLKIQQTIGGKVVVGWHTTTHTP
jgi:hypothetical protein